MTATSWKCSNQDFGASPRRSDYSGDTAASPANSLVFSVKVVVTDARLLMICHNQRRQLGSSGPRHQPNEPLLGTAVHETLEETDITCEVTGLLGIYTDAGRPATNRYARV
jgi:ADP-ribose pyrophosphatase YjhB (NUDIX family)